MKLITPADIRSKALRIWQKGDLCRDWLDQSDSFPKSITFRKVKTGEMLAHFEEVRQWITTLKQHSKQEAGRGYSLTLAPIQHRKMGAQQVPACISFDNSEDFLAFIGKTKSFSTFAALAEQTLADFPDLQAWLKQHPMKLLQEARSWHLLLRVCRWFRENPCPGCYIRELTIEGVDSKFIEQHKAILSELLSLILPDDAVDSSISGLARHGFERRFGLKYDEPLIRFRLLGREAMINSMNGNHESRINQHLHREHSFSDLSVPFSHFAAIEPQVDTIVITENKINGLSFPAMTDAMVVFGLGYGIEMLKNVAWLQHKKIIYWGDIDSHGFAILSQLRSYFPQVRSLCMDIDTLQAHQSLWGEEPQEKRCLHDLLYLTVDEEKLFQQLQCNTFAPCIRLEQERIHHDWLCSRLYKESPC